MTPGSPVRRRGLLFPAVVVALLAASPPVRAFRLAGRVMEAPAVPSAEALARLEAAAGESEEAFTRIFREVLRERPVSGAAVVARAGTTRMETTTDADGAYTIDDLPQGVYQVHAEDAGDRGSEVGRSTVTRVRVVETSGIVSLRLHHGLVVVAGRVIDRAGRPVAGARVTGTAVPVAHVGLISPVSTSTDADGRYRLNGFAPVDLYRTAGFLNGGSLDAPLSLHTQVEIRVAAGGLVQPPKEVPRLPLIPAGRVPAARGLLRALTVMAKAAGEGDGWGEAATARLPPSRGNTLVGVDIVLDPADPGPGSGDPP